VRKPLRIAIVIGSGLLVLVVSGGVAVYRASQQVPEFYQQAIKADTTRQAAASKQMLQQATTLVSDAQKTGQWQAEFTDEQINGWLAVDLVKNHGDALPPEIKEPRVAIRPNGASIGWRWQSEELSTVFSLDVELYLAEPNVVALAIRGAHAGRVPLPLTKILDEVSTAAGNLNLHVRWLKAEGDPVALVTIPPPEDDDKKLIVVETLELRQGSIFLAGKTVPREDLADYCRPADLTAQESGAEESAVVDNHSAVIERFQR
jgi:hypothetical protein